MYRYDIINYLIQKNNFKKYLEIGVRNPDDCFNRINAQKKFSVDPCYEFETSVDYKFESDSFFKKLEDDELDLNSTFQWDIIFIDGLHLAPQVENDILNSLNHIVDNGFIILHDCNPPSLHHAREDFLNTTTSAVGDWNGTVWKAFYKFRATRPDLEMFTIDTDWGVGVIKKGHQECCVYDNPFFEYHLFEKQRNKALNLISVEEFTKKF